MCSSNIGTGIVGGLLSGGGNIAEQQAQISMQRQEYGQLLARNEIERRQADDIARMRAKEAILNYQQLQLQEQEANEEAVVQKAEIAREIQKARALTEVVAMESGAGANMVTRAMADLGFTEAQKMNAVEATRASAIQQAETEKVAVGLRAQVQPVYSALGSPPSIKGGNFLAAALSGLGGYMAYGGFDSRKSSPKKVSETSSSVVGR